ncbi:MAG: biotin/lipoate--protein ligase family protein [Pseudomonadota bacterium]
MDLSLPPLFTGQPVPNGTDPFEQACSEAADPGSLYWSGDAATARAAVVLEPEAAMPEAMCGVIAAELGLAEALGALGPPELAVQFRWPDGLVVNGARCGAIRAAQRGDLLITGIRVALLPVSDAAPGTTPDATVLSEEGAPDIDALPLIEAWARHMLTWINRYVGDGPGPLVTAWAGLCVADQMMGLDPLGGLIVQTKTGQRTLPLTDILERP